ncbi:alpha/beta hydrolase [Labrenzia sp. 011]|uniref:alpha/beta fold hydrolase n=1 Tax=Labrenzia sp. 011 TaxID=2171494 RepID=UPI000D5153D5|nr:alpha/beta hydrolase [Labrenzia sp. 011]PVB63249.1 alpha/beta hydrolase [Labrenzia sp. 011]
MTIGLKTVATGSEPVPVPSRFTWKSPDGLTLAGYEWRPARQTAETTTSPIAVLCLPGLSRNTRDFNDVAKFLQFVGHHVIALDYRGRGMSEWDPDWRNYDLTIEGHDIDAAIAHLGLDRFAVLGTSRGGMHAFAMAGRYPADRMAAVILNDIGPHIEMRAIHRIAATLGHNMTHASLEEVAISLQRTLGQQFPAFQMADWRKFAGQIASVSDGRVVLDYDPALARQLASLDDAGPVADLWHLYEKLTDRPVLILRGEHSDLLSEETCRRMLDTHPNARLKTVREQGHAPMLWERETHEEIARFLKGL